MTRVSIVVLCAFLFLGYSGLRIVNFTAVDGVREFPDTKTYVGKASWRLWSWGKRFGPLGRISTWVLNGRPLTVPLFYKLAGNSPHQNSRFQLFFSIACWTLLALAVVGRVEFPLLKPVAFLIVLLFSLSDEIIMWDKLLLSESISVSLLALFVAGWLWLTKNPSWLKILFTTAVAFFWVFSRDTNAWVILIVAGLLTVSGIINATHRRYLVLAAAFAIIFVASETSNQWQGRWRQPFMNVIGRRILPDAEATAYLAQLGMPVTPELMRLSGHYAWDRNRAFFKDPALEDFRNWLNRHGKSSYVRFLLAHPSRTAQDPLRNAEVIIAPKLDHYRAAGFYPIVSGALAELIYAKDWALFWLWTSGLIVGLSLTVALRTGNTILVVPLVLILLTYPHAVIIWHGDAAEVGRHALQVGVHFRLGLWLLIIYLLDIVFLAKKRAVPDHSGCVG